MEGAGPPSFDAHTSNVCSNSCMHLTEPHCPFGAGGPKLPSEVVEQLRQHARRLLPHPEGDFSPSGAPPLLDKLTDASLVIASDLVRAEASALSGKARLRLLAWLLADARGATTPLDKKLADTVGKRLERQAERVRSALDEARATAEEARAAACAAAALATDAAARCSGPCQQTRRDQCS